MLSAVPLSELSRLEFRMNQEHSSMLLSLANTLRSAAAALEMKAREIQQYDECARIKRKRFKSKTGDEEDMDQTEGRVIMGAMSAAAAIQHEHTINEAIRSLLEPVEGRRAVSDEPTREYSGGSVLEVLPDIISTYVCHLAAQMLADQKSMGESDESANRIDSQAKSSNDTSEDESAISIHNPEPSSGPEDQRPHMPPAGFVTASGWVAINRRQNW